jgi:dolichyl-phosphate-mannose--protein O-mannosyl transferase
MILIARKLTQSHGFASSAGLLLAVEGQSIVLSRTAILDGILTFFVLLATWLLLKAIEYQRSRLAKKKTGIHLSPWVLLLGIGLGLASSVKWSGIFFVAAYGLITFIFDWRYRAHAGQARVGAIAQGFVNALALSLTTLGTYLLSWLGWFADEKAWGKDKDENPLLALLSYHQQILSFHTGLDKDHPYQSSALQWLVNARPTAFYFENLEGEQCWVFEECSVAITAMPNLVIWFGGLIAMLWLFRNRLRMQAPLVVAAGFLAAWLPWLFFPDRTIFQFYAVLISPFFILALVLALQHYWRRGSLLGVQRVRERRIGYLLIAALVTAALYVSLWVGLPVPTFWWRLQLFLPFWI